MLNIPVKDLRYAKLMHDLVNVPYDLPTRLVGWWPAPQLTKESRERLTKFYPEGNAFEAGARYDDPGLPPYLVMILETDTGNALIGKVAWVHVVSQFECEATFVQVQQAFGQQVNLVRPE